MTADLHAQNAALKNRITHLENVVRDHEIAEEKLQEIAGAAYQVVGVIASKAGVFDTAEIEHVLDFLSQTKTVPVPIPFKWPEGHRTATEWKLRERQLLEANNLYLLKGRHAEPAIKALEYFVTETRAYTSPECEECEIVGPILKQADEVIAAYRTEFPA